MFVSGLRHYSLLQMLSKFTECVYGVIKKKQANECHSHGLIATSTNYPVIPSKHEFDTQVIIDADLAEIMVYFIAEAMRGKLDINADLLHRMVSSCDVHLSDNGRFLPYLSNILYTYLSSLDAFDDATLDIAARICKLSDVDLVNATIPTLSTLLHYAVEQRNTKLIQFLLDH